MSLAIANSVCKFCMHYMYIQQKVLAISNCHQNADISIATSQVNEFISKDKEDIKIHSIVTSIKPAAIFYYLIIQSIMVIFLIMLKSEQHYYAFSVQYTHLSFYNLISRKSSKKKINEPLLLLTLQHWLDPKKRVCRQIRGVAPITLYLGVKFYAADPCRLVEEITRYQFFLQVKQDVLQGRLPVPHDLAVELGALALQCK